MKTLSNLRPVEGSNKKMKRVGRGVGSGHGKTACRGYKGQKSRTGKTKRPWFEGGQMPLQRRLPKRGFKNIFKKEYSVINVSDLEKFENGTVVTVPVLKESRLIRKVGDGVKLLGGGSLTKKLKVVVHKASEEAVSKVKAAGGEVELLAGKSGE